MNSQNKVRAVWGFVVMLLLGFPDFVQQRLRATEWQTSQPSQGRAARRELVEKYCLTCHNQQTHAGGLVLEGIDLDSVEANTRVFEKVLHKLRTKQMPPMNMPRPNDAAVAAWTSWLANELDRSAARNPNPGSIGVHRLNRTEYANGIRDLLHLDISAESLLLPDESDEGFDNIGDSLTLSPAHLERYLSAAKKISSLAVGDSGLGAVPVFETYAIPWMLNQDVRVSEDLPFGSRGGIAVRHHFPLDAEYLVKVRLQRQAYHYIIGMGEPQRIDIRIDGRRVGRLTVGGEAKGPRAPLTWAGEIRAGEEFETYMHSADESLEIRVPVKAGTHAVGVSFVREAWEPEGVPKLPHGEEFDNRFFDEKYDGYAAIDSVAIGGPYNAVGPGDTAARKAVFVCRPRNPIDEEPCARQILSTLARRAYRRPVTDSDIQRLMEFYRLGRSEGSFDNGIQAALERLLVSFNFLFRVERTARNAAPRTVFRLSDVELASRLSFFLWSSIPDEPLLSAAIEGKLSDPAVLEQQVKRMLADPRSRALVDNFAAQWLGVRRVKSWQPNATLFPDFDENLRKALVEETEIFVTSQLREDRSVIDLISANYTYVNERLARHYGISEVYGDSFRRVSFTDGSRGGLLGQAGILMITSYPDRTAPVVRGKWVLDNILGMSPPPPPPDIPPLEDVKENGRILTVREQMELHRKNPSCAGCHVRMDPIGFALENFNAVGQWRSATEGKSLDVAATFADGTQFEGVTGLRKLIMSHRQEFVYTLTSKLLTYALGRTIDYYDQPAIRKVVRDAATADNRWSAIILGIVKSSPFQMGRTAS